MQCVCAIYDEYRNLQCNKYLKKVDEQGQVYLEYTYSGNKAKHMKVDNKAVRRYENVNDEEHCVVNIFEKYLSKPRRETNSSTSALFQTMGQVFQDLVTRLLDKIS